MWQPTLANGLSSAEAKKLLSERGHNEIKKEPKLSSLKIFLSQFKSPLIYILVLAGVVALLLGDYTDSIVIFSAVFINTLLGFYQEGKAQKTLEALNALIVHKTQVIRDNKEFSIEAKEVVPGDLVILGMGDQIPADGIIISATDLSINEAVLTGESMPVKKSAFNWPDKGIESFEQVPEEKRVYGGTTVLTGKATAQIIKTGAETEVGKIGEKISDIKEVKTPLQEQLARVAQVLAVVVAILSVLIFVLGKLVGYETLEIFTTSVAVAVAAIPEGLVVTLTVILALGMRRILDRKAIVRRLLSAETLGSVSVICADKTGTITEGKMKVVKAELVDEDKGFLGAMLCSELKDPIGFATWEWVRVKAKKNELNVEEIIAKNPRLDEVPFSPQKRMLLTLHPGHLFVAGAPERVLELCSIPRAEKEKWLGRFDHYAQKGLRLVGYARRENKRLKKIPKELERLEWLGILVFEDPVRPGVKEALAECRRAGIAVKVITGDYQPTAEAVLAQIGLNGKHSLTGEELERMESEELKEIIDKIVLFARTTPEQKFKIVEALKEKGEVVAMTGDGVNDALALKKADIGIVVGEAADVARETADMVLLDSNFATIVAAVEEGRSIFENIKKVVLFLLSDSFTEIVLVGGSLLMGLPLPVTAAQILWVNLIEDSLPGMALAFEKEEKEIMKEPPRVRESAIIDSELKFIIFVVGFLLNFVLLGLFVWLLRTQLPHDRIQSLMFIALGIDSIFVAFACRSLRKTVFEKSIFDNKALIGAVGSSFFLLVVAVYFPPLQTLLGTHALGGFEWGILIILGILSLILVEMAKFAFVRIKEKAVRVEGVR